MQSSSNSRSSSPARRFTSTTTTLTTPKKTGISTTTTPMSPGDITSVTEEEECTSLAEEDSVTSTEALADTTEALMRRREGGRADGGYDDEEEEEDDSHLRTPPPPLPTHLPPTPPDPDAPPPPEVTPVRDDDDDMEEEGQVEEQINADVHQGRSFAPKSVQVARQVLANAQEQQRKRHHKPHVNNIMMLLDSSARTLSDTTMCSAANDHLHDNDDEEIKWKPLPRKEPSNYEIDKMDVKAGQYIPISELDSQAGTVEEQQQQQEAQRSQDGSAPVFAVNGRSVTPAPVTPNADKASSGASVGASTISTGAASTSSSKSSRTTPRTEDHEENADLDALLKATRLKSIVARLIRRQEDITSHLAFELLGVREWMIQTSYNNNCNNMFHPATAMYAGGMNTPFAGGVGPATHGGMYAAGQISPPVGAVPAMYGAGTTPMMMPSNSNYNMMMMMNAPSSHSLRTDDSGDLEYSMNILQESMKQAAALISTQRQIAKRFSKLIFRLAVQTNISMNQAEAKQKELVQLRQELDNIKEEFFKERRLREEQERRAKERDEIEKKRRALVEIPENGVGMEELQMLIDDLNQAIDKKEEELKESREIIEELNIQIQEAEDEIRYCLERERSHSAAKQTEQKTKIAEQRTEIEDLKEKLEHKEHELGLAEERIMILERRLERRNRGGSSASRRVGGRGYRTLVFGRFAEAGDEANNTSFADRIDSLRRKKLDLESFISASKRRLSPTGNDDEEDDDDDDDDDMSAYSAHSRRTIG